MEEVPEGGKCHHMSKRNGPVVYLPRKPGDGIFSVVPNEVEGWPTVLQDLVSISGTETHIDTLH